LGKIFIEDTEITFTEKKHVDDGSHVIEKNFYICRTVTVSEFKSSIYSYDEHQKILVSRTNRFNEDYFKIVLFDDKEAKAWNIIELPSALQITIKRKGADCFVVVGDSKFAKHIMSQVSFCTLKSSGKVEHITVSFNKLKEIYFMDNGDVLIDYCDFEDEDKKIARHTLQLYESSGTMKRSFYEYKDGDSAVFSYEVENNKIKIFKREN